MATWPAAIEINRKNYNERPPKRALRSNMDVGPDKVRKRSSSAIRPISFRLFLTDSLLDVLDNFYDENEAIAFDFTDPRTGIVKRARFVDQPSYDYSETMWDVSIKLEYLPDFAVFIPSLKFSDYRNSQYLPVIG